MIHVLQTKHNAIAELCERFGVARLHAFGSTLRDDFDTDRSDVDLLVEFKPMAPYERVNAYFGMLDELRILLDREVDLVMAGAVKNPYISRDIDRTKQLLYAGITRPGIGWHGVLSAGVPHKLFPANVSLQSERNSWGITPDGRLRSVSRKGCRMVRPAVQLRTPVIAEEVGRDVVKPD